MKKCILLLILGILICNPAWSMDFHKQMLMEGRSWKIMMVTQTWEEYKFYPNVGVIDMEEAYTTTYTAYTVTGKTVMDGKPCYCINRSSFVIAAVNPERYSEVVELPNPPDVFYMYEENGKVYSYTPNFSDGWQLEFDGNLQSGEAMPDNRVVDLIDAITVNDEVYRRFTFKDGSSWIEGIGSPKFGMLNAINSELDPEITVFKMETVSVCDNGNCIFETDDFTAEGEEINDEDFPSKEPTGICDAPRLNDKGQMTNDNRGNGDCKSPITYNLNGQRLTQKPEKGVYIENGRKRVVK
jgi:hypothetical protein